MSARLALLLVLVAARALAHPMGNFSIGRHATLRAERDGLALTYVVDMAEVPTYQLHAAMGLEPATAITQADVEKYRARTAPAWLAQLALSLDGQPLELRAAEGRAILTPGAGGLPTVRFETRARAEWPGRPPGAHALAYRDGNFAERVGWKEVVLIAGEGVAVTTSSVPASDRTAGLTRYPDEAASAPSSVTEAKAALDFKVVRRDPRVAPQADGAPRREPGGLVSTIGLVALACVTIPLLMKRTRA